MLYTLFFAGYHFPSPANIGVERMCFLSFAGRADRFARFLPKISVGSVLAASWGPLAANTEKACGGPVFFDPLGAVLAVSWPVLAASWGRLGRLGGLLGPSWARLGGQNRTQTRLNLHAKIDHLF